MKTTLLIVWLGMVVSGFTLRHRAPEYAGDIPKSFYDFKMKSIDGKMIDFSSLKGKKVMCVNVASKCGQTPQYADLQKLNDMYGDKVVILGFPANNFGQQEPGTNMEIKEFCKENYGVTFQMFEKISVKGDDMAPLYQWLSKKEYNGWNDEEPNWNFSKYLIDEKGKLVAYFPSKVKPLSEEVLAKING
ncbi:MAG TPA: glutathione peroxidase [Cyclobacteriaceae bacterium]|nr:glutathione peroxidase [Cyclobacteriaceae bacterium]